MIRSVRSARAENAVTERKGMSDTETNEASAPDHIRSQVQTDVNVRASTSDDACNDQEALPDEWNGHPPSRSRYGRTIKLRSIMSSTVEPPQNWRRRQLLNSIDNSMDESIGEINTANSVDETSDSSATLNSLEEIPSPREIRPPIECPWMIGQLAWARVGNFPFWPCMVTVDPILRIHYKLKVTSRSITTMIHVHYFGDKGRHSWVSANYMMQFTSLLDFLKIAESLTAETKKKEPKYAAAFIIKPGARAKWQNAVQEATEVQPIAMEERVAIFATKVKVAKSKRVKSVDEKNKNKRKHSIEQNEPDELIVKRTKLDVDNVCNEKSELSKSKNSRTVNDKVDSKINSNSLPSSPSSHKSSSESTNTKVIEMDEETMFKLYYLENRGLLQNEYPNMPRDGIERYLRNTWNNMNREYQKKLCSHISEEQKRLLLKESALEKNESIEIETIVKENKKVKSKIDRKENSVPETKRNRLCKSLHLHSKENTSDEDEVSTEIDTSMGENKKKNKIDKEENSISETKRNRLRKSSHSKENTPDKDEMSVEADITVTENKKIKSKIDREENFVSETKRNRLYKNSHSKESSPDEDEISIETPDITTRENKKRNKIDREENSISETKRSRVYKSSYLHSKESTPEENEISIETETSVKENKKTKNKIDREENSVSETKRSRLYNLFKGMKQEKVCQICEKTGKLTRCKGPCYSYFHLSCVKPGESSPEYSVDENTLDDRLLSDLNIIKRSINDENENNGKSDEQEDETFKCIDCLSGVAPACFLCNEREGDRVRCIVPACGKHYHSNCLRPWPQSHWQGGRLICPYHICHTCSSDNPQDKRSRAPNEKMARCVRCPSSYHASTLCLPAGSVILTASQIICPKHYKAPQPPLNAAWCFLCTDGGTLICCDTCPTSFHLKCLGIDAPDGGFICEDCETGRLPLYGEVVWVKLGHYRWWPSRICYPHEIPENVRDAKPNSPGKFCVMFLGSNDYYWVHRGRAFLYQDGDANIKPPIGKSQMDDTFRIALEEANKIHQQLKARRSMTKEPKALKPPPYVKLKVNKPVGNVKPTEVESIVACECDPDWDNPCAPGTDCLNRILMVECSPGICPAGVKCMNQSFVLRQYPAMEPFHTVGRGWGLRTLEDIKAGQFVIEYVGEIIDDAEYKRRLHRKKELKNENFYFLTIDNNRTIDAEPKGNLSRFMNHSCAPNCETQKWTVNGDTRIGLFALRDIKTREELTFNYNLASDGETRKACLCGASNCSGFIGLKAPKQQLSTAQSVMQLKKIDKSKRHKRWRKYRCWRCGQEISYHNKFIVCSQRTCNKKYHKTCVIIDESSESKFCCPWHFCSECGRRTSAHCSFCSTAFCQVHLDGNLFERESEKGGVVCKLHENADAQKPVEDEKEYSDNDNETDKEYSSTSSTSPIVMEKIATRESSPRVSIVEVHLSSEESEESQKEEEENNFENNFMSCDKSSRTMTKKKLYKSQKKENQAKELSNLTSSQLEAIIGVSLYE